MFPALDSIGFFDNRDCRAQAFAALEHIGPVRGLCWLRWCCTQAKPKQSGSEASEARPSVKKEFGDRIERNSRNMNDEEVRRSVLEIWFDFWMLASSWRLDAEACLVRLEQMAKEKR